MNKQSKILTLDNLYQFFVEQNKTVNFSSKDAGKPIVVTTNGFFEANETDMPEMLKLELKVCHTDTNRNGSHISTENMEKAMPTLKYRPILAYIHELEDGTKDFYAHNVEFVENEDGETEIVYTERQVGCFTADDPWLKYDEKNDKTYVHAYAVIPEGYTEAADIIRRKGGTKVSCELIINELSYNAKEKYLDLIDFIFGGCTLLGVDEQGNEIGEGMLGARADIADFCHKEPVYTFQDKMIEVLDRLDRTISNFNKNSEEKGCDKMDKFEELLSKYNKEASDITFETEGLSDEELEAKFKEAFEDDEPEEPKNDEGEGNPKDDDPEPVATEEEACGKKKKKKCSVDEDGNMEVCFELSHDDIRSALYALLSATSEDGYGYAWIVEVFDDKFIYQDYMEDKFYRQDYFKDGDNVVLGENKVEVFNEWLSKSERDALDALKADYAALVEFKQNAENAEQKALKDAVFTNEFYDSVRDTDEFQALIADADKYTLEEVQTKADLIYTANQKKQFSFSAKNEEPKKKNVLSFGVQTETKKKKKAYGGLFDD